RDRDRSLADRQGNGQREHTGGSRQQAEGTGARSDYANGEPNAGIPEASLQMQQQQPSQPGEGGRRRRRRRRRGRRGQGNAQQNFGAQPSGHTQQNASWEDRFGSGGADEIDTTPRDESVAAPNTSSTPEWGLGDASRGPGAISEPIEALPEAHTS